MVPGRMADTPVHLCNVMKWSKDLGWQRWPSNFLCREQFLGRPHFLGTQTNLVIPSEAEENEMGNFP